MWVPELQFHFESKKLRLGPLGPVDGERKNLDCSLCHSKRGYGIIQCAHKRCLHAFHVSCASGAVSENYKLVQLDQDEGIEDETLFIAYCPLHNKSTAVWKAPELPRTSPHAESKACSPSASNPCSLRSPARPTALSPSGLLASQVGSSEKERKQFRRLKRKYDMARLSDGPTHGTPPKTRSPWAKRVRRSQQHAEGKRAQSKAIARMFIDDEVEAPSSGGEDEDEDDEMDEEDRNFINDSSQLIYSPSVPTPIRKKKKKRNSLGDMRAIYARSLIESPPTPAFLKRGRRNLPSNGVISACLQELSEERRESLSTSSRSSSQTSRFSDRNAAEGAGDAIELMDESQAGPRSSRADEVQIEAAAVEVSLPSFNLIDISMGAAPIQTPVISVPEQSTKEVSAAESEAQAARELREKIEANRLKALRLLEARKEAAKRVHSPVAAISREDVDDATSHELNDRHKSGTGHQGMIAAPRGSRVFDSAPKVSDELPSFNLLDSTAKSGPVASTKQISVKSGHATSGIVVYVQPDFRESRIFDVLEACMFAEPEQFEFDEMESLDVSALLSLRLAAIVLDLKPSETDNLPQHPVLQHARRVYKSFILVIRVSDIVSVERVSQSEATRQIRELPSCRKVIVACEGAVISNALLFVAREEASLGFGLPSGTAPNSPTRTVGGVDVNFHERFRFFQSAGVLSIGSVISLSFRFDKFTVKQIPVTKFGEMHWRRMLPWISETTAKQLHRYFIPRRVELELTQSTR